MMAEPFEQRSMPLSLETVGPAQFSRASTELQRVLSSRQVYTVWFASMGVSYLREIELSRR
jgi:hypothetical protein